MNFRIFTLNLIFTLYLKYVFQYNVQYSVQIKLGIKLRKDLVGIVILGHR